MRIERVDENKIKVLIDDNEARERNITKQNISQNTPEVQEMFRQAIGMAQEHINFSVEGAKLFVEAIPSYELGIGMLITRIYNEEELNNAIKNCSYKGKIHRTELKPKLDAIRKKQRKYIYKFEDFETMCDAIGELGDKFRGFSTLYKLDEKFYLYIIPKDALALLDADVVFSEFAVRQANAQYLHGRLNEYGTLMIENNATEVISEYFSRC